MILFETEKLKTVINTIVEEDGFKINYYDQYLYIVNLVRTYPIRSREDKNCPINIKELRKHVSSDNAHKLVDNLVKYNILETQNSYVIGATSRKFTIAEKFLKGDWYETVILDKGLVKKDLDQRNRKKVAIESLGSGYKKALDDFLNLDFNQKGAMEYLHTKKGEFSKDKYNYYKLSIEMFKDKYFTVDKSGFRFHSNLTNLPCDLRPFLGGFKASLAQIDIKSSQPTFLGLKLKFRGFEYTEELDRYLAVCQSGLFYEFFAERCGQVLDLKDKEIRKGFKIRLFSELFFNTNRSQLTCFESVFQAEFPNIFNFIRQVKVEGNDKLATMLQNEESRFIFELVSRLDFEVYTIHDSIISDRVNVLTVKQEMEKLFEEFYNFVPNLEVEYLELS